MKRVLIVGLGRIGRFKAAIYDKLGYHVYGYDTVKHFPWDTFKYHRYLKPNGLRFDVVDICTPTESHIQVLEEQLQHYPSALFVIEKPLCSSEKDLEKFESLRSSYPKTQIIYSENYVFSSAIHEVSRLLLEYELVIRGVTIEFSKDRRKDIETGRFVDRELEGFGIEIPHMLMFVNRLGLHFTELHEIATEDLKMNNEVLPRQGKIFVKGQSTNKQSITFYQSLQGECCYKRNYFVVPKFSSSRNNSYRILDIECEENFHIAVQFEPIEGRDRYISRIMLIQGDRMLEDKEFVDDTLFELIRHVDQVLLRKTSIDKYLVPDYATKITRALIALNECAKKNCANMQFKW